MPPYTSHQRAINPEGFHGAAVGMRGSHARRSRRRWLVGEGLLLLVGGGVGSWFRWGACCCRPQAVHPRPHSPSSILGDRGVHRHVGGTGTEEEARVLVPGRPARWDPFLTSLSSSTLACRAPTSPSMAPLHQARAARPRNTILEPLPQGICAPSPPTSVGKNGDGGH